MLRILIFLVIIVASSCSSKRTKFEKYSKDNGGHQDKILEGEIRVVSFKANSATSVKLAENFAIFRAIEICQAENKKLTHLLDTFDKTQSRTVTRSSGTGYPSYYYGMSPFYNRYSSIGFGFSSMNYSSWNETLKYPDIEVIFECTDTVMGPGIEFREISAEDMKHLVKDLRGGLQVEQIPKELQKVQLKVGDIILYANGERVQQTYQLLSLFHKSQDRSINVQVMREGKIRQGLKIYGVDLSDKILEAQNKVIKKVCTEKELKDHKLCQK